MKFEIIDREGMSVAKGNAELNSRRMWCGQVVTSGLSRELLSLFNQLEQAVNQQMFLHAERLERCLADYNLRVRLEDGRTMDATGIFLNDRFEVSWKDEK